jgi:hypothetical protein
MRVVVNEFMSLDGVSQAPGGIAKTGRFGWRSGPGQGFSVPD